MKKLLLSRQIIEELVVEENSIGIFWIGHSSFVFKTSTGKIIFVDPYLSNSVEKHEGRKRLRAIPIKPENVVTNLVLCTHDHLDHTDPETLMKIANGCNAKFVGPSSSYRHMRNLGMDKNELPRPEGRGILEQLQLFRLMFLVFYVPSYYLRGNFISCGSYKISVVPEFSSPEISLEMRKFHEHFS